MATLISRFGGVPDVAPSVRERALRDNSKAFRWAERLFAGDFATVVFMTGAGLGYLRDAEVSRYPAERLRETLQAVTVVCRGPKPPGSLHELGVRPQVRIPEPKTTTPYSRRATRRAATTGTISRQALAEHGLTPDIVPAHPKMGVLVRAAAEESRAPVGPQTGLASHVAQNHFHRSHI